MWCQVSRQQIVNHLRTLSSQVINRPLTPQNLTSLFRSHISTLGLRINIRMKYMKKFKPGIVAVGGEYCPVADSENRNPITLFFVYNNPTSKIKIGIRKFRNLLYRVADTLLHEIIHLHQNRSDSQWYERKPIHQDLISTDNQKYLARPEEIDAYAFNIACWLIDRRCTNKTQARTLLTSKIPKRKINTELDDYLTTFGPNHPVINYLFDCVVDYLPRAAQGKPYLPKQWEYLDRKGNVQLLSKLRGNFRSSPKISFTSVI